MRHLPANGAGFEAGQRVPAWEPDDEEERSPGPGQDPALVLGQLLRYCIQDADPAAAGRRLFVLAFACHWPIDGVQTVDELAKVLGLRRRRTAWLLSEIRAQIARIG
jgi:hypothetical protein